MKIINCDQLVEGMILNEAVYDNETGAELLSAGAKLSLRQIRLLRNLEITNIKISEDVDVQQPQSPLSKEKLKDLFADLEHIDEQIFEPAERNAVNKNMEVNVLTGEGNVPIDVKHSETIQDTKDVFESIKSDGKLDLDRIKKNLVSTLPDMVRNNDVLMRLNQLKQSDDYTFEHSMRVSILASMVAKWFGYSQSEILEVSEAGMLYDIGKLSIPDEILKKPGPLTEQEMEIIKKHPQLGYSILLATKGVTQNIKYAALHHHERMDGSGYPLRLRENQIHYFAKIIMVCDVFDALTNNRIYKKKISPMLALDYLMWNAGTLFDAEVVYVFVKNISHYFVGKLCKLSNGDVGKIVFIEENYPTRPIVKVGDRFIDLMKEKKIDLEELY